MFSFSAATFQGNDCRHIALAIAMHCQRQGSLFVILPPPGRQLKIRFFHPQQLKIRVFHYHQLEIKFVVSPTEN